MLEYYYFFFSNTAYHPPEVVINRRHPWSTVKHIRLCPNGRETWNTEIDPSPLCSFFQFWYPLLVEDRGIERPTPLTLLAQLARGYQKAKADGLPTNFGNGINGDPPDSPSPGPSRPSWMMMPTAADDEVVYPLNSWAREFVNYPSIQTLAMNFHCPESQRDHFEAIIDYVVDTWRFPLNPHHAGYHYLSAEGNPLGKMSWRGQVGPWEEHCLDCGKPLLAALHGDAEAVACPTHAANLDKVSKLIGQRMYTWIVTWTRSRHDGPEKYPYGGLVEVDDGDYWEDGDSDTDRDTDLAALGLGPPSAYEIGVEADEDGGDGAKEMQD